MILVLVLVQFVIYDNFNFLNLMSMYFVLFFCSFYRLGVGNWNCLAEKPSFQQKPFTFALPLGWFPLMSGQKVF